MIWRCARSCVADLEYECRNRPGRLCDQATSSLGQPERRERDAQRSAEDEHIEVRGSKSTASTPSSAARADDRLALLLEHPHPVIDGDRTFLPIHLDHLAALHDVRHGE